MERHTRLNKFYKMYIGIFFILFFSACSSIDKQRISPAYFEAYGAITGYFFQEGNDQITPELIKNIPYASAILKIGRGKPGLIILEKKDKDIETWVSADGVYIVLKAGRIIRTKGLDNNLDYYRSGRDVVSLINSNHNVYLSFDNPPLFDLPILVETKVGTISSVGLFNKNLDLIKVEEVISNNTVNWKSTNLFWLDKEGYVWKSEQNISPKLPTFYLEITKRPK